jgi:hypothetical protein
MSRVIVKERCRHESFMRHTYSSRVSSVVYTTFFVERQRAIRPRQTLERDEMRAEVAQSLVIGIGSGGDGSPNVAFPMHQELDELDELNLESYSQMRNSRPSSVDAEGAISPPADERAGPRSMGSAP